MADIDKKGKLYVVATPIGNLEDITLRALRILKEADFVLCEDTRVTQKLLNKYEIKTKSITLHKFNEKKQMLRALNLLEDGKNIALVSDAGTPSVSDPGCELVSEAVRDGIKVIPIPGASALISALSISPIKFKDFYFAGFLPDKSSEREKMILSLRVKSGLVALYVAPHDLKKYLKEIDIAYPEIEIFYARELTKIYEESWHGKIRDLIDLLEQKPLKGEIVLILNMQNYKDKKEHLSEDELINKMKVMIDDGKSLKETAKYYAKEYSLSSNDLYKMYLKK